MSQKEKITVVLSGVNTKVHQVLEKADFYTLLGKENICPNINVALERAHKLVDDPTIANRLSLITGKSKSIVMAKRKSSKKQSQGVIYLIVLACLALICREPIARALQDKLPVVKERITQKATPVITGSPLLPAPLKNVPEQILHRKGYTTSYNREHKIPNWVAWELTPEKLIERESRTDKFLPDPDLPESQQ